MKYYQMMYEISLSLHVSHCTAFLFLCTIYAIIYRLLLELSIFDLNLNLSRQLIYHNDTSN